MAGNHSFRQQEDEKLKGLSASFISDVEMAHDEVFAGPISESVPSSVTGFAHRDSRADSVTSFTYFQENGSFPKWTEDEEAIQQSDEELSIESANSEISDSIAVSPKPGRLSVTSITSVEDPLLRRHDSARTDASAFQSNRKNNQKIYLKAEDLTIALSGFTTARIGLDTDERHQREQVFGKNQIDVKEKSIPQILVGEKQDLSLKGESVPVSKVPISDKLLQQLESSSGSIAPEIAKSFLYSGTKIIRARRPQDGQDEEAVALGLIVRTGFNTTKGALVRSMLFPKPSGFKFYEDAFRYISVMAGVAGIGFIASFVNFIRLNVKS
ncbi:MAG: hypothetical protein LQ351_002347 [Letrouitia transgressa]|nr:MAG: hypothetical protein LQ351_002347 [Letrouitia transgressa]